MQTGEKEKGIHIYGRNAILYEEIREILEPLSIPLSFYSEADCEKGSLADCRVLILDAPAAQPSVFEEVKKRMDAPRVMVLREEMDPSAAYFRGIGASACLNLKNVTPVMLRRLTADYAREWEEAKKTLNRTDLS